MLHKRVFFQHFGHAAVFGILGAALPLSAACSRQRSERLRGGAGCRHHSERHPSGPGALQPGQRGATPCCDCDTPMDGSMDGLNDLYWASAVSAEWGGRGLQGVIESIDHKNPAEAHPDPNL